MKGMVEMKWWCEVRGVMVVVILCEVRFGE